MGGSGRKSKCREVENREEGFRVGARGGRGQQAPVANLHSNPWSKSTMKEVREREKHRSQIVDVKIEIRRETNRSS